MSQPQGMSFISLGGETKPLGLGKLKQQQQKKPLIDSNVQKRPILSKVFVMISFDEAIPHAVVSICTKTSVEAEG